MDMIQALGILCPEEKSEAGLKAAYKKACLKHHPDKGGDVEIMKLVNAAYDFLKKCDTWWTAEQVRKSKRKAPLTETMQTIIDSLKPLAGIKIEIIGSWLWVSGMTFNHVQILKSMKMRFSGNKKAWYYHEDAYRKRSKKLLAWTISEPCTGPRPSRARTTTTTEQLQPKTLNQGQTVDKF